MPRLLVGFPDSPLLRPEAIDAAGERGGVRVSGIVLAEARQLPDPEAGGVVGAGAARGQDRRVDARVAVVTVDVAALEGPHRRIAHHVAPDQRAESGPVAGREQGGHVARRAAAPVAAEPLVDAPAVVR